MRKGGLSRTNGVAPCSAHRADDGRTGRRGPLRVHGGSGQIARTVFRHNPGVAHGQVPSRCQRLFTGTVLALGGQVRAACSAGPETAGQPPLRAVALVPSEVGPGAPTNVACHALNDAEWNCAPRSSAWPAEPAIDALTGLEEPTDAGAALAAGRKRNTGIMIDLDQPEHGEGRPYGGGDRVSPAGDPRRADDRPGPGPVPYAASVRGRR